VLDCADDCDDAVDCTSDACVDGQCVHTPVDTMCDDGVSCTIDACDAELGCVAAPDDTQCDDAIDCTNDSCDVVLGCASEADDGLCDDGNACSSERCDPRRGCQQTPTAILVLNLSNDVSSAPQDAVSAGGYTPIVVDDFAEFNAGFDAGGFEAIVWDASVEDPMSIAGAVPPATSDRIATWLAGGGRLIFGYWGLNANPTMQSILGVSVTSSTNVTLPIHPAQGAVVDLFALDEVITPPISYPDVFNDNGDELALAGPGHVAGRFGDPAGGGGAIVVTYDDRVVVNGFMVTEIGANVVDVDADGVNDGEELLRNELTLVCAAR